MWSRPHVLVLVGTFIFIGARARSSAFLKVQNATKLATLISTEVNQATSSENFLGDGAESAFLAEEAAEEGKAATPIEQPPPSHNQGDASMLAIEGVIQPGAVTSKVDKQSSKGIASEKTREEVVKENPVVEAEGENDSTEAPSEHTSEDAEEVDVSEDTDESEDGYEPGLGEDIADRIDDDIASTAEQGEEDEDGAIAEDAGTAVETSMFQEDDIDDSLDAAEESAEVDGEDVADESEDSTEITQDATGDSNVFEKMSKDAVESDETQDGDPTAEESGDSLEDATVDETPIAEEFSYADRATPYTEEEPLDEVAVTDVSSERVATSQRDHTASERFDSKASAKASLSKTTGEHASALGERTEHLVAIHGNKNSSLSADSLQSADIPQLSKPSHGASSSLSSESLQAVEKKRDVSGSTVSKQQMRIPRLGKARDATSVKTSQLPQTTLSSSASKMRAKDHQAVGSVASAQVAKVSKANQLAHESEVFKVSTKDHRVVQNATGLTAAKLASEITRENAKTKSVAKVHRVNKAFHENAPTKLAADVLPLAIDPPKKDERRVLEDVDVAKMKQEVLGNKDLKARVRSMCDKRSDMPHCEKKTMDAVFCKLLRRAKPEAAELLCAKALATATSIKKVGLPAMHMSIQRESRILEQELAQEMLYDLQTHFDQIISL